MKGEGLRNSLVVREGVKEFRITYLDPQSDEEKWEERWDTKEIRYREPFDSIILRRKAGRFNGFPVMSLLAQRRESRQER
jgi:hypothetical protein